jgi:hypothetical protein
MQSKRRFNDDKDVWARRARLVLGSDDGNNFTEPQSSACSDGRCIRANNGKTEQCPAEGLLNAEEKAGK